MFLRYIRQKKKKESFLVYPRRSVIAVTPLWHEWPDRGIQGSFPDMDKGCFILHFSETAFTPVYDDY